MYDDRDDEILPESQAITDSDSVLDTLPIEDLFQYVTVKTRNLDNFATHSDMSERNLAKIMKQMGYYAESVPIKQIEFQLDGEIQRICACDLSEFRKIMSVQAYGLNMVYHYALEKFTAQKGDDVSAYDTRFLHYALMAQSMFMNTAKAIQNDVTAEQKRVQDYDPYKAYR